MTDEELAALGFEKNENAARRRMPSPHVRYNDLVDVVDEFGNVLRGQPAGLCFIGPCIYTHWRHSNRGAVQ